MNAIKPIRLTTGNLRLPPHRSYREHPEGPLLKFTIRKIVSPVKKRKLVARDDEDAATRKEDQVQAREDIVELRRRVEESEKKDEEIIKMAEEATVKAAEAEVREVEAL
ncbi:hypothetical protein L1987_18728 [Smallanthus sonchifolius]|uniref:Uncharacterized protein n=1 Tax=Smallanthus sonchifolius TaxID=185202 RepID=A0ACB9J141_9ASTR|nr:hypothetical protein L1987_18728 [Smallanthus sonchifolius]